MRPASNLEMIDCVHPQRGRVNISTQRISFGEFELDVRAGELRKGEERIRLQKQPFEILLILLERPGEVVMREEICDRLWPNGTVVEFEHSIGTAIKKLRQALGDEAESPRYVETLPRRGFRFIFPNVVALPRADWPHPNSPLQGQGQGQALAPVAASAVINPSAVASVVPPPVPVETVIGSAYRFVADVVETEEPAKTAIAEILPPHTSQSSASDISLPSDPVGAETQQPETPGPPGKRDWSPRRLPIALGALLFAGVLAIGVTTRDYLRQQELRRTVAPYHVVFFQQSTFDDGDDVVTAEAVSPDASSVAYSQRAGVTIRTFSDRSERLLPAPANFDIARISWDVARHRLLVSGFTVAAKRPQVWAVSLAGGPPSLFLDGAEEAAISPGGRSLAYTRNGNEVWVSGPDRDHPRKLIAGNPKESFPFLLWSPDGNRLILQRRGAVDPMMAALPAGSGFPLNDLQLQLKWDYESVDAASGKLLAKTDDLRFDSSYILADGRIVFLVNDLEPEKKNPVLLSAASDPATGRLLAPPVTVETLEGTIASKLTASADGTQVAYVMQRHNSDVFVSDLSYPNGVREGPVLGKPVRVTHHSVNNYPHAFTRDGSSILLENGNIGYSAIYRQKLDGSPMERVAQLWGLSALPAPSPDGKWILFMGFSGVPQRADAVYRVPISGGKPEQIPVSGTIEEFHCPDNSSGVCVLREMAGQKEFVYYVLDPVWGVGRELARVPWEPNILGEWSLSPDSSTVAVAHHDPEHPFVQFIKFPSGGAPAASPKVENVPVEGFGTLLGTDWSFDGRGLFVESKTNAGYDLVFVPLRGRARVLRQAAMPQWGVPSRDGKKLVFPDITSSTNLWTISVRPY